MDKFPGIEISGDKTRDNCIILLLKHASKNNFDPISTVKAIIERSPHIID